MSPVAARTSYIKCNTFAQGFDRADISMSNLLMIVDDRDDDCLLLAIMLRKLGVSNPIVKFENGAEAIDYLAGRGKFADRQAFPLPSVLFLDLIMPGTNGFDVLQWLKQHPCPEKCLILVVSELHALADLNKAYQLGATSFLSKPLNEAEFRECFRMFPDYWEFSNAKQL